MLTMGFNYLLMIFGTFFYTARLVGTVCNFLLALLSLIGAGLGISAFSGCNLNVFTISEYDGNGKWVENGHTYAEDGLYILIFAIIQSIVGACQLCYCGCPLFMTKAILEGQEGETPKEMMKVATTRVI